MTERLVIVALLGSMLANILLLYAFEQKSADYNSLQQWACDHGNGGFYCGEE